MALRCVSKPEYSNNLFILLELGYRKEKDVYVWKHIDTSSTNKWTHYPLLPWSVSTRVSLKDLECFPKSRRVKILAMKIALKGV